MSVTSVTVYVAKASRCDETLLKRLFSFIVALLYYLSFLLLSFLHIVIQIHGQSMYNNQQSQHRTIGTDHRMGPRKPVPVHVGAILPKA